MPEIHSLPTAAMILGVMLCLGVACPAQDERPAAPAVASQDIVVETVGGLPVVKCAIRFQELEIEGHLIFDLSLQVPFQIHKGALGGLGLNAEVAKFQRFDIEFSDGVKLLQLPVDTDRYPLLEAHTRLHAGELGEVPVIGFLGPAAFDSNVIELDMGKGLLRTMGLAADAAQEAEMPYRAMECGIVVAGTGPAGMPVQAVLSTRLHDSALAPAALKLAREKGAKPNVLAIAEVDWGARTAIRFDALDDTWPESVNAVVGAEALAGSVVTLWPKRGMIAAIPRPSPPFPENEQRYFIALADSDAKAVTEFIQAGARRRLLDEACLRLMDIRLLDARSSAADLIAALDLLALKHSPDRRSVSLLNIADALEQTAHGHREQLVGHALELAIRESGEALEPTAIHDVHIRIGRRAFAKGDLLQARRHLLSAAFGMPKDAACNYWMGEVYRETGKLRRAWSRYFQALLDESLETEDPIRAQALQRLDELNRDPKFRETFNMPLAEEYMAGRLAKSEFHAETRHRFVKNRHPHRIRMAELFVDSSDKAVGGMELAFQALDEFFEGEVVLVSYHLNDPMHSEAARERLAFYQKTAAPLVVLDGKPAFETALGKGDVPADDAAANYPLLRDACLPETAPEASDWQIGGTIRSEDGRVKLKVSAAGGGSPDDLRLVVLLCERSVMAVGENGVFFHHFVVRDLLTPPEGIAPDKAVEAEIDVRELSRRLAAGGKAAEPFIDAQQLFAVGFVQRRSDSRILAAEKILLSESP